MISFILTLVMCVSFVIGLRFAGQQIKRSAGCSILAWYSLIYMTVMNLAMLMSTYMEYPRGFRVAYDSGTFDQMKLGMTIINVVCIAFLRRLSSVSYLSEAHHMRGNYSIYLCQPLSPRILVSWLTVPIGIWFFFNMPTTQNTWNNLGEIFRLRNYSMYYQLRSANIFLERDLLSSYLVLISLKVILPLLNLYSLYMFISEKKRNWRIYWISTLAILFIVSILELQKAPILIVILNNVILILFIKHRMKMINWRKMLRAMSAYFFVLVLIIYGIYRAVGYTENVLLALVERLVSIPIWSTYATHAVFPDLHPHTYFGGSRTFNFLLGFGQSSNYMSQYTSNYIITAKYATSYPFDMNTSILGDGWANMGYLGIVECAILLFGFCYAVDIYFAKRLNVIPILPLIAFFIGNSIWILNVGILELYLSYGMLIWPIVYIKVFGNNASHVGRSIFQRGN